MEYPKCSEQRDWEEYADKLLAIVVTLTDQEREKLLEMAKVISMTSA